MDIKKLAIIIITTAVLILMSYTAISQNMTQPHPYQNTNKEGGQQNVMSIKKDSMQHTKNNKIYQMCGYMADENMLLKKQAMMISKLPNMKQQLSLNNNQVKQLNDLQSGYKKQQSNLQSELKKKQTKLRSLLGNMASTSNIEQQLQENAETMTNMKITTYETAKKMKNVLNNDQQEVLKSKMMQQESEMMHCNATMNKKDDSMMQSCDEMKDYNRERML